MMIGRLFRSCALVAVAAGCVAPAEAAQEDLLAGTTYTQRVIVTLKSPEAAAKAQLETLPLYGGAEWAVSCRWDDNIRSDLRMRDVMEAHGYRGTWYLTAPKPNFGARIGRHLLTGGNSIGGHSMTHPFLTAQNRNRQFYEVAAVRVQWEAATDSTICSFAFPFLAWSSSAEGQVLHRDLAEALRRAGYYHVCHQRFNSRFETGMVVSALLPGDGKPIAQRAEQYLASASVRKLYAQMSFNMHVWYKTDEAWAAFEKQLDAYGRRPNWWYCNQSQYAAYRRQYKHATVGEPAVRGAGVAVDIERPRLLDLNDPTPLCFAVRGVPAAEVAGVACATADVEMVAAGQDAAVFNLRHDRDRRLPEVIALIENRDNHAAPAVGDVADEPDDLTGLLHWRDGTLELTVENRAAEPLRDVTVTYRLPLRYEEGLVRKGFAEVKERLADTVTPAPAPGRDDYKYAAGTAFYAAQVDFTRGDRPYRLHLTCHVAGPERDPSYPQGGFAVLGPIPPDKFDMAALTAAVAAGTLLDFARAAAAKPDLDWRKPTPQMLGEFDTEVVVTGGKARNSEKTKKCYVLRSVVQSEAAQECEFRFARDTVPAVFVNRERVEGNRAALRKGANELVMVNQLNGAWYGMHNAACFIRLCKPGTQERLRDLRFEAQ